MGSRCLKLWTPHPPFSLSIGPSSERPPSNFVVVLAGHLGASPIRPSTAGRCTAAADEEAPERPDEARRAASWSHRGGPEGLASDRDSSIRRSSSTLFQAPAQRGGPAAARRARSAGLAAGKELPSCASAPPRHLHEPQGHRLQFWQESELPRDSPDDDRRASGEPRQSISEHRQQATPWSGPAPTSSRGFGPLLSLRAVVPAEQETCPASEARSVGELAAREGVEILAATGCPRRAACRWLMGATSSGASEPQP